MVLTVSRSGNVEVANAVQRVIYGIVDFFDAGAPRRRMIEAREAVRTKLSTELQVLLGPTSTKSAPIIGSTVEKQVDNLINTGNFDLRATSNAEKPIKIALTHIQDISAAPVAMPLKFLWQAVSEQRQENKPISILASKKIASNAMLWKTSLHLPSKDAFRLASNAWKLYEKKQILPEDGKAILMCAGRLQSRHGFSQTDALNYAIDLFQPMRVLQIDINGIEGMLKILDQKLPELRTMTERLRISAAIRHLQLQDAKHENVNPIEELRKTLRDLPLLQKAMPKGCVIDQIHQGAHVRGSSAHKFPPESPTIGGGNSLSPNEQALMAATTKMLGNKNLGDVKKPVHGVHLPEDFSEFDRQHIEDLVRGNRFELLTDNKSDAQFEGIENTRRKNPKAMSQEDYQSWIRQRIAWAGSLRAAQFLSHLQSQSLFGDIGKFAANQFRNKDGYSVVVAGDNQLAQTTYQANRVRDATGDVFHLHQTHFKNAEGLLASPGKGNTSNNLFKQPTLDLKLLPNPGDGKVAGPGGFSVKQSCVMEARPPALPGAPASCRIIEVSEEWDLMIDWDKRMTERPDIGTL
jgi:hypothetical protein